MYFSSEFVQAGFDTHSDLGLLQPSGAEFQLCGVVKAAVLSLY